MNKTHFDLQKRSLTLIVNETRPRWVLAFVATLIAIIATAPVEAQTKVKKKSGKLTRPNASAESVLPEPKVERAAETAIRRLGLAIFPPAADAPADYTMESAVRLCEEMASELEDASYYRVTCLKMRLSGDESPRQLAELGRSREVDGILSGSVGSSGVTMKLYSGRSGREISQLSIDRSQIGDGKNRGEMISAIVDTVVDMIPYRGFVTRVYDGKVDLNLGADQGLQPGVFLKLYEFNGSQPTFSSSKTTVATVEVVKVDAKTSVARIVDESAPVKPFAKISHETMTSAPQAATTRVTPKGLWFSLGTEMMNIDSTADSDFNDRKYRLNGTPFVQVGFGGARWFAQLWYGYAQNNQEQLSYAALLAAYQVAEWGGSRQGVALSIGGWLSQYSASTKLASNPARLLDTSRYSPYLEARYQYVLSESWKVFASGEAYYPIFVSGQSAEMLPFSFGLGSTAGLHWGLTDVIALEAGGRFQYLVLPVAGNRGVTEQQNGLFVRGLIRL